MRNEKIPIAIAVDFDGTLFTEYGFPNVGEPFYERCWLIDYLYQCGITIVIWTLRNNEKGTAEAAIKALEKVNVRYDYWNETPEFVRGQWGDQRKPGVHYFIDDRNAGGIPDVATILCDVLRVAEKEGINYEDYVGLINISEEAAKRIEHTKNQEYYYSLGDKKKIKWLENKIKDLEENINN